MNSIKISIDRETKPSFNNLFLFSSFFPIEMSITRGEAKLPQQLFSSELIRLLIEFHKYRLKNMFWPDNHIVCLQRTPQVTWGHLLTILDRKDKWSSYTSKRSPWFKLFKNRASRYQKRSFEVKNRDKMSNVNFHWMLSLDASVKVFRTSLTSFRNIWRSLR